ncbi:MAG: hypothetical protein D6726_11275 [Nitrospirae bacterium]|nr:MAG: hypothetical protein D6726_11275 [Nitrospirota bacterium]
MIKTAVVDIDNTLWQFCDALFEKLRYINPEFPPVSEWRDWDFWEDHCSEKEFFKAISSIHLNQDSPEYTPYPDARDFLLSLKQRGYRVVIASHRDGDARVPTENWLKKHHLFYDELHLSYDKTTIFGKETAIVVDDAPHILEKATMMGISSAGLMFPWNKEYGNNGFKLCRSLTEILKELD